MTTKDALVQYALGKITANDVVAQCPRLVDLPDEISAECDRKSLTQSDRNEVRVLYAFVEMAESDPEIQRNQAAFLASRRE